MDTKSSHRFVIMSILAAFILVLLGVIFPFLLGNFIFAAVVIAALPPFCSKYVTYRWVKGLEAQFPNFIRDLADTRRSGMSFKESIKIATKANYGSLSPEILRMHNKLSWDIPFLRVLDMFMERVKSSKLIRESLTIIKETYQAGGDVASTLEAIARDIVLLKETEAERSSMMRQNVMIMYGIFFMFVGISIMIIFVMIPMIQSQPELQGGSLGFAFTNPCEGLSGFPCELFSLMGLFLGIPLGIANYYIAVFFSVILIQGFFTGMIAGQLGENSIIAGSKHALIMVFSGMGVFIFLGQTGLFPI